MNQTFTALRDSVTTLTGDDKHDKQNSPYALPRYLLKVNNI